MAWSNGGGLLNLAVLPTLCTRWLIPRLVVFSARYPDVTVNIASRHEPFDFAQVPLDAAIHFGTPHWAGAVCEYLMHEQVVPLCSPGYQQQHGIRQIQDLSSVVVLQQTTRPTQWADWFEQVGIWSIPSRARRPLWCGRFATSFWRNAVEVRCWRPVATQNTTRPRLAAKWHWTRHWALTARIGQETVRRSS
ncbi:MAG: LysR substrate-binding domain-containing protein [Rhodoferax sp.]|uniref:LysR substrate-binding domain-containing protein n=1 Tax=Rhodoferax sp. TaxID=50421 RepID=UPI00262A13F6|nr:LysR substrate-binding domain-containing protein [Rhodoferax sp.]MDD2878908.1 LysR substrate-binding domain-containing protein [Rhodoferax sp.]